jgi:putative membrane protein
LFGIAFAIPHANLWTHPGDAAFFAWAIGRGGWLGMVSGAVAMTAWGIAAIGWRRTLTFAAIAIVVSAAAELTGTKTGWPFGGYEYLELLGWKIAGRVPFGVPLSWFYMGFASYALAARIVARRLDRPALWTIVLASWLLTSWDLVLDPAMAALPQVKFWEWHEQGPYFGMPLRNLLGWFGTSVAFVTLGRLSWGDKEPAWHDVDMTFPFCVYVANIVWSMLLAISAGLWWPAALAVAFSLAPAVLALRQARPPIALDAA